MPAINPRKLNHQLSSLTLNIEDHQQVIKDISNIFLYYSNAVSRQGDVLASNPKIPSYNVPKPVFKSVYQFLIDYTQKNPEASVSLIKSFWKQEWLEFRVVAVYLLGTLDVNYADKVFDTIETWMRSKNDPFLHRLIAEESLRTIRSNEPTLLLNKIHSWIYSDQIPLKYMGFFSLALTIENIPYDYLPKIYQMISPFAYAYPIKLRKEVIDVFQRLARRSPNETAYYLRLAIEKTNTIDSVRLVKACLPTFPSHIQIRLKEVIDKRKG